MNIHEFCRSTRNGRISIVRIHCKQFELSSFVPCGRDGFPRSGNKTEQSVAKKKGFERPLCKCALGVKAGVESDFLFMQPQKNDPHFPQIWIDKTAREIHCWWSYARICIECSLYLDCVCAGCGFCWRFISRIIEDSIKTR